MRSTHTYATLEIPKSAYDFIAEKLKEAGYDHAFIENDEKGIVIDMHGIGLITNPNVKPDTIEIVLGKSRALKSHYQNTITFTDVPTGQDVKVICTNEKAAYDLLHSADKVFSGFNGTVINRIEHSEEAMEIYKEVVIRKLERDKAELKLQVVQLNAQLRKKNRVIKFIKSLVK